MIVNKASPRWRGIGVPELLKFSFTLSVNMGTAQKILTLLYNRGNFLYKLYRNMKGVL